MKEIKGLKPFGKFIMTIGQLPASYLVSMTYEEQLIWLCNYLQNVVIPTVNNNGEAVEELQNLFVELKSYVDNYFDNLDVQEEINNKLDEMAESGQLADVIAQFLSIGILFTYDTVSDLEDAENISDGSSCYILGKDTYNDGKCAFYRVREILNTDVIDGDNLVGLTNFPELVAEKLPNYYINEISSSISSIELLISQIQTIYDTVADLQADTSLIDGKNVRTLGYYAINDGGGAYYKIRTKTVSDVPNGGNIIALGDDLVAELVSNKAILEQFGAKGDGTTDDSTAITNCITYAKTNGLLLTSNKKKTYLVSTSFDISDLYVNFNYSTFTVNESQTAIFTINTTNKNYEIKNVKLDCNNYASVGLKILNARTLNIKNFKVYNILNQGIQINSGYEIYINNVFMYSTTLGAIGIELNTSDCDISDVIMTSVNKAFKVTKGSNTFSNVHCWIADTNLINTSVMYEIALDFEGTLHMTNIYNDTYRYFVKYENNTTCWLYIDNFETQYNQAIYTSDRESSYIVYANTDNQTAFCNITNAFIKGLGIDTQSQHSEMTNRTYYYGGLAKADLNAIINKRNYVLTDIDNSLTVLENNVSKNNGVVTITFTASYNAASLSGVTLNPAAKLGYWLMPTHRIIGYAQITDSLWDYTNSSWCYMFVDRASEKIQVRFPTGQTGTKVLHINITYIAEDWR